MRPLFLLVLVTLACCLAIGAARTQNPDKMRENVFRMLFPSPTGQNGYEELIIAGDVLLTSIPWREAEQNSDKLTLEDKRRVLSTLEVKKTLGLLRQGLRKQIASPRTEIDDETRFPEMARFRALARLLSTQMYVQLADGHVAEALDDFVDTLRFGYQIQRDTLIGGLVGIAVDVIGMKMISEHVDQLSARDCDRLVSIANQWLELPDPSLDLMAKERDKALRLLKKYRDRPHKLIETIAEQYTDSSNSLQTERLELMRKDFKENGVWAAAVFDEAAVKLGAKYERAATNFRKPVMDRAELEKLPPDDTVSGLIAGELFPQLAQISDRYGREQALIQLLGVHGAIRRYRWEHNRLPESLEVLKLGRLAIDPFTGAPLNYKKLDDKTYELFSAGPLDSSEGAVQGSRVKIK